MDTPRIIADKEAFVQQLLPAFTKIDPSTNEEGVRTFVDSFVDEMEKLFVPTFEKSLDDAYNMAIDHCKSILEKCGADVLKAYRVIERLRH